MSQYRNTRSDVKVTVAYWREECTVKDWKSGKCLDVCVDEVCMHCGVVTYGIFLTIVNSS